MTQLDPQGLDAWALLEHMTESVLVSTPDLLPGAKTDPSPSRQRAFDARPSR